jgi:hypothetical protein
MRHAPRPKILSRVALGGAALFAMLASCINNDDNCPSDWLVTDSAGACPYGPPGGPQKKNQASLCPPIAFNKSTCAGVTFEKNVFSVFTGASANCTSTGCHGTQQDAEKAKGLYFPKTIAAMDLYKTLTDYKNPQGQAYWGADDKNAWVLCNVLAQPGGGSPMPKPGGLTVAADQQSISAWVTCGMEPPGSGTGGAGSTSSTGTGG